MEYFNFGLYFLLLFLAWKFKKGNYTLLLLIGVWAMSSFVGLFYVKMDMYRGGYNMELMPFLFLFSLFVISLIPLFCQRVKISHIYFRNQSFLDMFAIFVGIISLWPFLEHIIRIVYSIKTGEFFMLGAMYDSFGRGESARLIQLSKIGGILTNISMMFRVISPILFLYYVSKSSQKKLFAIFMFINAIIPSLSNVCTGGKTQIVFFVLFITTMFLFTLGIYTVQQRTALTKLLASSVFVVLSLILILSISRYYVTERVSSVSDTGDFLFKYTAESMFNFNQWGYHESKTLGGYATIPSLLDNLGISEVRYIEKDNIYLNVMNYMDTKMTGSPVLFYTLFGDFYLDFGPIVTIIIFVIASLIISSIKIKKYMDLSNMVLLSLYLYILSTSLFYFCFKTNLRPIYVTILFCIILKLVGKTNRIEGNWQK